MKKKKRLNGEFIEKKRMVICLLFFSIIAMGILVRIGYLQFVKGEEYQKQAYAQQNKDRELTPSRGTIYDRNGKELAISISVDTISISPNIIRSNNNITLEEIASELSDILDGDYATILEKINRQNEFEVISKQVNRDIGDKVRMFKEEYNILGLSIDEDTKRYYPNANLAAQVIGFTGTDNQGLFGVELTMEEYLKGTPGKILTEVDELGVELPFSSETKIEALNGYDVVLTIDETIQYIAETALKKAVEDNNVVNGATAIVMNPNTGEILAMVSAPDFDLNNPRAVPAGYESTGWTGYTSSDTKLLSQTVWRNKAISDTYEPGSTFKSFTAAAGIEENVVSMDTITNDFPITVQDWDIYCWRKNNPHGIETFLEAIYNSCNPAFVKVSQALGIDVFYNYIEMFGFYKPTGIDLPGEADSFFQIDNASIDEYQEIDMAVASFGQRFTITPIQLITAYCAIANGGDLLEPLIVKELLDEEQNIVKRYETEVVRQVISQDTSDKIREALEGNVNIGTGKNAFVPGYSVAGKTGTSQTNEDGVYIASFCGFAPSDNPVITVLVVLDNPQGDSVSGGTIAAPVVGAIMEETLEYLQVPRDGDDEYLVSEVFIPDVKGYTIDQATKRLDEYGLTYIIEGNQAVEEATILYQYPLASSIVIEDSVVILYTYNPEESEMVKMPYLGGKSIYEATATLNALGLNINASGLGECISQQYPSTTLVEKGSVINITFRYDDNVE